MRGAPKTLRERERQFPYNGGPGRRPVDRPLCYLCSIVPSKPSLSRASARSLSHTHTSVLPVSWAYVCARIAMSVYVFQCATNPREYALQMLPIFNIFKNQFNLINIDILRCHCASIPENMRCRCCRQRAKAKARASERARD